MQEMSKEEFKQNTLNEIENLHYIKKILYYLIPTSGGNKNEKDTNYR